MVKDKLVDLIRRSMLDMERSVTLPDERYRALKMAESFMEDLLDPKKTARVPRHIRQRARSVLRHYPTTYYLDQLAAARPDIITPRMEELHRFIAAARDKEDN